MIGVAVHGDGRGTKMGFPTANLKLHDQSQKPANGIYACSAKILPNDVIYKAVLHVGPRPTFKGTTDTIEVHLLDFPWRKLYDSEVKVFSLIHIREIKKFSSSEDLISALTQDVKKAQRLLSNK